MNFYLANPAVVEPSIPTTQITTRLVGRPGRLRPAPWAGGNCQTAFDGAVVDIQPEPLPNGLLDRVLGLAAPDHRAAQFNPLGEFVNGGAAPRHGSILPATYGWREAMSGGIDARSPPEPPLPTRTVKIGVGNASPSGSPMAGHGPFAYGLMKVRRPLRYHGQRDRIAPSIKPFLRLKYWPF
jgi:hypothetical protein